MYKKEFSIELYDSLIVSVFNEEEFFESEKLRSVRRALRNHDCFVINPANGKTAKTTREAIDIIKTYIKKNNWKYKEKKYNFERVNGPGFTILFTIYKREDS